MRLPTKLILLLLGTILLAGIVAMLLPWGSLRDRVSAAAQAPAAEPHDDHAGHDHGHEAHTEGDHVDVSAVARQNLGLKTGRVGLIDYPRTLHIPGEVVESPGYSTTEVPARVVGVVTRIHVAPGQAVKPGDLLFDVDLTGEALVEAQSGLLDDLRQLATTNAELERLGPLAAGGSVAAKERLQLQYEKQRLESRKNVRMQELLVHGLTSEQVQGILESAATDNGKNAILIRSTTIAAPPYPEKRTGPEDEPEPQQAGSDSPVDWEYTVEEINAQLGQSVSPQDSLCRLARHTRLRVRGLAFERDIPVIASLPAAETVTVEFGGERHAGGDGISATDEEGHGEEVTGLKILSVDNHVDPETQTFAFYIPLENKVLKDVVDSGRVFRSWKYKPGQRVHVRIPIGPKEKQIVLPLDAIADEGLESFVFRVAARHRHEPTEPGEKALYDDEFVPVSVVVLYRDSHRAVIAQGGALKSGDLIAMNRAYQLLLAMKTAAGGGAGHDHHGHSH